MQLGWFGLPERSWASLWICNHTSVSTETAQIPFHTLAIPAQPLLSLSCRSTWGIWRIWGFSPNCVFMLLPSFLFTDFFFTHSICTTRYSWVQTNNRKDGKPPCFSATAEAQQRTVSGRSSQTFPQCMFSRGRDALKKKEVRMGTQLLHRFMQSCDRQPTSFLLLWFFQNLTDGNEFCRLQEGKVLEQLSEKNIIYVENAGGTILFLQGLTPSWVPVFGEEIFPAWYPASP